MNFRLLAAILLPLSMALAAPAGAQTPPAEPKAEKPAASKAKTENKAKAKTKKRKSAKSDVKRRCEGSAYCQ